MIQLFEKIKPPVKQLFYKVKNNDYVFILLFVVLSLKVRLQYFFFLMSPGQKFPQSDDSQWYLDYAHHLMTTLRIGMQMDDILYLGYNVWLTLLLAIFKDPIAVVFIQAVTAGLSVILVYKISRMLFNQITAIIASYFYCYYAWGITLWSTYILADSFFISLLLLCVYFLLMFMETHKRSYKILFMATLLYVLVFKPTGIITVGFIMVYIGINLHKKTVMEFIGKYRFVLGGVVTACIAAGVVLYMGGKLDPLISSMQFNAKKVLYNIYAKGWIYDRASAHDYFFRPHYEINFGNSLIASFLINNWDHIAVVYGKRTIAFLGRWVWETDLTYKRGILKFAENMLPTVLFMIGTVFAVVNGRFRQASIVWLMVLAAFVFCIIFFIDGMYRYRTPAIPFIAIIAAYGLERMIQTAVHIARPFIISLLSKIQKSKREQAARMQPQAQSHLLPQSQQDTRTG